jgi:hypothetical protein
VRCQWFARPFFPHDECAELCGVLRGNACYGRPTRSGKTAIDRIGDCAGDGRKMRAQAARPTPSNVMAFNPTAPQSPTR